MQRLRKTLVVAAFSAALVTPAATAAAVPLPLIPLIPLLPGSAGTGSAGAGSAGAGAGSADQIPPGSAEQPQQQQPQQQPQPQVAPVPDAGTERAQVLASVNAARGEQGCAPLREDPRLAAAAQAHADDMAARGYFGHTSPEGTAAADRVAAAGYAPAQVVAENLAGGQQSGQDVVASWLGSEGHRANIVNCQLVDTGVGVGVGAQGPQWVQVFATP